MKKYAYVDVQIGKVFFSSSQDHRAIIDEYAAQGWRYAGFLPTGIDGHGRITDIDLIFERDLNDDDKPI